MSAAAYRFVDSFQHRCSNTDALPQSKLSLQISWCLLYMYSLSMLCQKQRLSHFHTLLFPIRICVHVFTLLLRICFL